MDCASKMIKKEGFFSMYKGMSFPLASVAAVNCIAFGAYSNTLRYIDPSDNPELKNVWISGAVSGIAVCSLRNITYRR